MNALLTPPVPPLSDQRVRELQGHVVREVTAGGSPPSHRRVLAVAATIVVLAGALSVVLATQSSTPSDAAIRTLIANAVTDEAHAGTIQVETTVSQHFLSTGESLAQSYSFNYSGRPGVEMSEETYHAGPVAIVTVIQQGATVYVRSAAWVDTAPPPIASPGWFSFQNPSLAGATSIPKTKLGRVVGITGPIKQLGSSVVAGVPVTGYQVTINVRAAIAESTTSSGRASFKSLATDGVTEYPEQVWMSAGGQIKKLQRAYTVRSGGGQKITTTNRYSYASKVFSVATPPAVDVTPVGSETEAFRQAYSHPVT